MARPKRGEAYVLTIDDLAFGGEAVGRADGYVVFVPGGVPGDRVRVRLEQARSGYGRGAIESIEEPSPHRVEAPCPYFGRCGGCRLQHVAYPAQLVFKGKQVADVLQRLGNLAGFQLRPIIGASEIYGYRNKMEFTIARAPRPSPRPVSRPSQRGEEEALPVALEGEEGGGRGQDARGAIVIGLHEANRYDSVLDVERCLLQSDGMNALLDEARGFFVEQGLSAYHQDEGDGLLRFLMLREGRRTGEAMVNVVTTGPAVSLLAPLVERLRSRLPRPSQA